MKERQDVEILRAQPELLAWVGEDEMGSGQIGLKQALTPAGMIPIVVTGDKLEKIGRADMVGQMQRQSDAFGKTIRLVRYVPVEVMMDVRPRGHG